MTPDDFQDDAEFEAFLQRRGELPELLRALPQPEAPADLDAAILAQAAAALAGSRAPGAANDAVIPAAQRKPPSLLSRWRWPLGLAASVLLMIPVFVLLWHGRFNESDMSAAAPPPAATAPAAAPAPAGSAAGQPARAEPEAARAPHAGREDAPKAKRRAEAPAKPMIEDSARETKPAARPGEPQPFAPEQAPAAPPPAAMPAPAPRMAPSPAPAMADAAPQAFPQAGPPPAAARAEAGDEAPPPAAQGRSAAAKRAMAPRQAEVQSSDGAAAAPDAWLARIEKLIKAGSGKQALEEWARFKRAYPDYPVRKALSDRIEELKKESQ